MAAKDRNEPPDLPQASRTTGMTTSPRRLRILFGTRLPGAAMDRLATQHDVLVVDSIPELVAADPEYCRRVEILAPANSPRVDESFLHAFAAVRLIAAYGVGTDHIDLPFAERCGIAVTHTAGVVERPTAEVAMGLVIGLMRRLREGDALLRLGRWKPPGVDSMLGTGLENSRLGIVGLGGVGQQVARLASAFRMRITYTQGHQLPRETEARLDVHYATIEDLLASSDVVTLHCPLTPATYHLIGAEALRMMATSAFLVNTSRGAVVDEAALVHALQEGSIAGAGLDVYEYEPRVASALLTMENVFLTPHLGTSTRAAREAMTETLVGQIEAFSRGEKPDGLVHARPRAS
jgi:glyoxylate reductase